MKVRPTNETSAMSSEGKIVNAGEEVVISPQSPTVLPAVEIKINGDSKATNGAVQER